MSQAALVYQMLWDSQSLNTIVVVMDKVAERNTWLPTSLECELVQSSWKAIR
jgi:hypothetical protein